MYLCTSKIVSLVEHFKSRFLLMSVRPSPASIWPWRRLLSLVWLSLGLRCSIFLQLKEKTKKFFFSKIWEFLNWEFWNICCCPDYIYLWGLKLDTRQTARLRFSFCFIYWLQVVANNDSRVRPSLILKNKELIWCPNDFVVNWKLRLMLSMHLWSLTMVVPIDD